MNTTFDTLENTIDKLKEELKLQPGNKKLKEKLLNAEKRLERLLIRNTRELDSYFRFCDH